MFGMKLGMVFLKWGTLKLIVNTKFDWTMRQISPKRQLFISLQVWRLAIFFIARKVFEGEEF